MARRRYQSPKVFTEGKFWKIRYREEALNADGNLYRAKPKVIVGPAFGPGKLTKKQAQTLADENILRPLNAYATVPQSVLTVEQFVAQHFQAEVVERLKWAGQCHYRYCLAKLLPILRDVRLRDLHPAHAYRLVQAMEARGYSRQTVTHVKVAGGRIWAHAKSMRFVAGDNPFSVVEMPEEAAKEKQAFSAEQAQRVFARLESPIWEMCALSTTTSMNVAELCGLRLKYINLTAESVISSGECIPPFSLLVRWNYYRNRWDSVKSKARRRTLGIPDALIEPLGALANRERFNGPDHPLFASRNGTPLDAHNIAARVLRPLAKELGFPISWHIFRHTAATMAESMEMVLSDRIKLMGHATAAMTQHYTHSDVERRRKEQNKMASLVLVKGKAS